MYSFPTPQCPQTPLSIVFNDITITIMIIVIILVRLYLVAFILQSVFFSIHAYKIKHILLVRPCEYYCPILHLIIMII